VAEGDAFLKLRNRILRLVLSLFRMLYLKYQSLISIPRRLIALARARFYLNSRQAKNILAGAKSVEEFWELSHKKQSRRWITGSLPSDELGYLQFSRDEILTSKILVVGIGTGATSNYLADLGYEVSVLDIVATSFDSLSSKIEKRFLTTEYEKIPVNHFNFVLHHLVAQHMADKDLQFQINVLYKSLAPGGMLKLQFASSLVASKNDQTISEVDLRLGQVLRSKEKIVSLISEESTGKWTISGQIDFPNWEEGWSWYLLEIVK